MYPLQLSYDGVGERVTRLIASGFPCEALFTAVFTAERMLRRTLVQLAISAGFTTDDALRLVRGLVGLDGLRRAWNLYDPKGRSLSEAIGSGNWSILREAVKARDEMTSTDRSVSYRKCKSRAAELMRALADVSDRLVKLYEYDGWGAYRRRWTSALHTDPKVPK